jgi:hypothetical protein
MQNKFLKLVFFWAIFSILFSLVSAYFAFSYADVKDVNVGDLMEGDALSVNKSFSFISDEECVSAKSVVYDFVKDKKSFPIYQGNDLGVFFDYKKKYYHLIARCKENKLTIEIKEQ